MESTSSARDRLLEAATRLSCSEGIHAVGVDKIIAQAQVTRAAFYPRTRQREVLGLRAAGSASK